MSTTTEGRRKAWPSLDETEAITIPSGYTIHVRKELEAEAYYVLADILLEQAKLSDNVSREARATRRALHRETVLTWVTHWDILPPHAEPGEPPMPVSDEALRMLDVRVSEEISDAVGRHQQPFLDEIVQILTGAPKSGKTTAAQKRPAAGAASSSASASGPTPRPTSSRAGRRVGS